MMQQRVHRFLAAVHQVQHARAAGRHRAAVRWRASASAALFPRASARTCCRRRWRTGYIHIGTMAGKVEGRDAGAHADGLADGLAIDARAPRRSSESPIIRLGMPQATSTIWIMRRTSALASSSGLAVFARQDGARRRRRACRAALCSDRAPARDPPPARRATCRNASCAVRTARSTSCRRWRSGTSAIVVARGGIRHRLHGAALRLLPRAIDVKRNGSTADSVAIILHPPIPESLAGAAARCISKT